MQTLATKPGTQPQPRLHTGPRSIAGGDGDDTHTFKLHIHSTGATTGWARLWIDGNLVQEGFVDAMSYSGEDLSCAYCLFEQLTLTFGWAWEYHEPTMTIRIRTITSKESEILDKWQRCDNVVGYRRARILRLAEQSWQSEAIADVLGVHVETVRQVIKDFNKGGIDAIAPRPRSGGR